MGSIAKCLPRFHNHIFCPDGKGTALCRWLDLCNKHGHYGAWHVAEMAGDLNLPITLWPSSRSERWKQKSKANKLTASPAKHAVTITTPINNGDQHLVVGLHCAAGWFQDRGWGKMQAAAGSFSAFGYAVRCGNTWFRNVFCSAAGPELDARRMAVCP